MSGADATWKLRTAELPALKEGQVLAKVQYFSNDTGLRHCKIHGCSRCSPGVLLTRPTRSHWEHSGPGAALCAQRARRLSNALWCSG